MKRWILVTVLLYGALLVALSAPLLMAMGFDWFSGANSARNQSSSWTPNFGISFQDATEVYTYWGYWFWLLVMMAAQACLLLVPLNISQRRPQPQRSLAMPVCTTAFLLANLTLAGLMSLAAGLGGDSVLDHLSDLAGFLQGSLLSLQQTPVFSSILNATAWNPSDEIWLLMFMAVTALVFWMFWGLIFYNVCKTDSDVTLVKRSTRWLLRGSILEFLIAVPCHVAVRHRNDCCAAYGTFWGLTMGLSVMLIAFGPGLYFLFAARIQRLQPREKQGNPASLNAHPS